MNRSGILAVDEHETLDYVTADGRRFGEVLLTLDADAHARLRTGFQCVHCQEVFEDSWPEQCRMCGFPVATAQRELVERSFEGFVQLPPPGLTAAELARGEAEFLEKVKKARL